MVVGAGAASAASAASSAPTSTVHVLATLSGIGAVLLFVPAFSYLFPAIFSLPLAAFWFLSWYIDARFTAKNWQYVVKGHETNVFVATLARAVPCRPAIVLGAHAVFSFGTAAALQVIVTHTFDVFVASCILVIFGIMHVDAFYRSREFVTAEMEERWRLKRRWRR